MGQLVEGALLASGARTSTQTLDPAVIAGAAAVFSASFNGDAQILEVCVDLTAFAVAASLTTSIEVYDTAKAGWISVLSGTTLTGNGTQLIRIGPRVVSATNTDKTMILWPRWRVVCTHGNANSHTYSVTARVLR